MHCPKVAFLALHIAELDIEDEGCIWRDDRLHSLRTVGHRGWHRQPTPVTHAHVDEALIPPEIKSNIKARAEQGSIHITPMESKMNTFVLLEGKNCRKLAAG